MAQSLRLEPDQLFGERFCITKVLKAGRRSALYLVVDERTKERGCLRVIHPELIAGLEARQRFDKYAALSTTLSHANLVRVQQSGVDPGSGAPYLFMEYLDGSDLDSTLRSRCPFSVKEAGAMLAQLGEALGIIHDQGLWHGGIKPSNLFLTHGKTSDDPPQVKLLGFGLGQIMRPPGGKDPMLASPMWLAPEQGSSSEELRPAVDVFLLGMLGFYLLTGRSYWRAANQPSLQAIGILREVMFEPFPPASKRVRELGISEPLLRGFDEWFALVVQRDIARRPVDARMAVRAWQQMVASSDATADATPAESPPASNLRRLASSSQVPTVITQRVPVQSHRPALLAGRAAVQPERPRPLRRWTSYLAATGPLCLLGVFGLLAYRHHQLNSHIQKCRALPPTDIDSQPSYLAACRDLCDTGQAPEIKPCIQLGDALTADLLATPASLREAENAYHRACSRGQQGGCEGMWRLGQIYQNFGQKKGAYSDDSRAFLLFKAACEKGVSESCTALGLALLSGRGVAPDESVAVRSLSQACELGHQIGCVHLGLLYLAGQGVPRDVKKSLALFSHACEAGEQAACHSLGTQYFKGDGVVRDLTHAMELYQAACRRGHQPSCDAVNRSALLDKPLHAKEPVPPGLLASRPSLPPLSPAVESPNAESQPFDCGNPQTCLNLGLLYREGRDVPKDLRRATQALSMACSNGVWEGCYFLAQMLKSGEGIPKDAHRASDLLRLACRHGVAQKECMVPRPPPHHKRSQEPPKEPPAGSTVVDRDPPTHTI